ncbi:MAG TPA: hypothetical protein VFU05_06225 [Cyclobacteriaceae bacterium]|nr:hypothetical protein [Cyclobacteriaceae bacterium]
MSPFEYVIVLVSIIYGLGITLILTGVAELIRRWRVIIPFTTYFIWIVLVFVLHVYEWWEHYRLRSIASWSLPLFLFVILYPILLFILANLLFPTKWPKKGINLKEFYFATYDKFFLWTILLALLAIIQNIFLEGYVLQEQFVQIIVLIIFSSLLIWRTTNVIVHTLVALLMLSFMLASIFYQSDTLLIQ